MAAFAPWGAAAACAVAAAMAAACGGPDPTEPLPLYTVTVLDAAQRSAPAGSELAEPLEVQVRDPAGVLAKGVAVRFRVVTGRGATLTDTLVATAADGVGMSRLRLGSTRDSVVVAASVRGQEDRGVTFRVTATAPPELLAVEPGTFAPGDTLTLRGRGLTDPRGTDAFFGSVRGRVVAPPTDTLLRVVVPPCLPGASVVVAVRAGTATTNGVFGVATTRVASLALRVAEGITVRGSEAGCLRLGTAGERYVVAPQLAMFADSVPTLRQYALAADVPTLSTTLADAGPTPTAGRSDARTSFEAMLRAGEERIARDGAGAVEDTGADTLRGRSRRTGALSRSLLVPPPSIGTTRTFHVLTRLDGTTFGTATARLRYAGANILLYEDVGAPASIADSALTALGDLFDRTLYRIGVETFGAESDIDANGRVIVLVTPYVNALTPAAQCATAGFVPGFFYGVDLDTRNRNSNQAEIFYAFAPDPRAERSCAHRVEEVLSLLPSTFVHEFQHMISFNQHVLVRRGSTEAVWLNEGLSHLAEELGARYFDTLYPAPSGRALPSALLPDSALPFLRGDLDNAALYLSTTSTRSVTAFQSFGTLEERGAAWLFLRWLGAQKGDAIYARLVQTGLRGGQNVESATGEVFPTLFGDFALSLYADSIPGLPRSAVPARLRMGARTLRELFARAAGRPSYPLAVRNVPAVGGTLTGAMVQGTAAFFTLTVPRSGVTLRLTGPGDAPLPATFSPQVGVLRIAP